MMSLKTTMCASFVFLFVKILPLYPQTAPFVSFNVEPGKDGAVIIQWKTQAANDSFHFVVERSRDKTIWESTAYVAARISLQYSSIDPGPGNGLIYYRIKKIKNDSSLSYSEVKWIQVNNNDKLYIWPNPAKSMLHVKTAFTNGSMEIVDPGGRIIQKVSIINTITDLPVTGLSKGMYFLHIKHKDKILVEQFIKE